MDESLDSTLERLLQELHSRSSSVATVANAKVNRIERVESSGVWISTDASDARGAGAQLVPAWMLNAAWRHLRATGAISHRYLLAADGLNVKRSSAVCALLSNLEAVEITSRRPIELRYVKAADRQ